MTTTVTGPILLPDTPDCDYPMGEELLTPEKISQLVNSFKEYNILDYEHQFTNPESSHFLHNIGRPARVFISDTPVTFTDMSDTQITVPSGTAWLESIIDDETVEKEIDDKLIVAYSVTVAEREDADYFNGLYKMVNGSYKSDEARQRHNRITMKRTLITDIVDPAMLTVSVVKFPCVYKAKFCKNSIHKLESEFEPTTKANGDMMADEYNEQTFFENIKAEIRNLRNSRKQEDTVDEESSEYVTRKELTDMKTEILDAITAKNDSVEDVVEEDETVATVDKQETTTPEEVVDEVVDDATEEEEEEETTTPNEDDEEEDEVVEKHDETTTDEGEVEEEGEAVKTDTTEGEAETNQMQKSSVGKAFSKKAEENKIKQKTAQPTRKTTLKHEGGTTNMKPIHERDIIQNAIKGDGTAIKSAIKNNQKIIYNTKDYNLVPYYQHKGLLATLNKAGKHVFEESFSEEETNKAILSTEAFAQYVREMITPEAIFDNANYLTVYGEDAPIRRVKAAASYTSQDGHNPSNYYYDVAPDAAELKHEKDVIRPVTQRDLFSISDRQLRNNAFGDDLLDASLETIKGTFYNGVYAARILGDTDNEDQTYTPVGGTATTIDTQFTRKDGWVKQAGVQLESTTDFDADNILDLFDTMFYSLPEYAQEEGNYAFFVPSQVRRAYYNHFIKNSRESKIDLVSERRDLYFNNIPILTSKTLSSAEFRNMLTGGDAKILLTNPQNTLLGVGRNFGIEPERRADISATYYYLTLDTDAKYTKPEEAVCATIGADDFATLPVTTEPASP